MLHEDTKTGGIAGEVAAIINEECFDALDAPIVRIASADTPVPFSPPLEEAFLPKVEDVVREARRLRQLTSGGGSSYNVTFLNACVLAWLNL